VCNLDPGAPHGKTVLGLSVVAWYDRGAGEWRVFDDACPHLLAPLSEGRIDDKGRLQGVYTAGASTAPVPASSSPRPPPSAHWYAALIGSPLFLSIAIIIGRRKVK
jgi:hypothetical protein